MACEGFNITIWRLFSMATVCGREGVLDTGQKRDIWVGYVVGLVGISD